MKSRMLAIFGLVAALIVLSTWTVSAQGPQPSGAGQPYDPSQRHHAQTGKPLVSGAAARTAATAPRIAVGQPGLSFRYVQTFGTTDRAYIADTQHLNGPQGLYIDASNNVFVAENRGERVLKYNSSGSNVLSLGTAGLCYTSDYVFCSPQDMAVDGSGNIWVADGNRVAEYSSTGTFLQTIPAANSWQSGSDNTHFNYVNGVALDNTNGRLFVSDTNNQRVQVYTFSGSAPSWSATIAGFNHPMHVAVDNIGQLYVADNGNNGVQKCTYSGSWSCSTFATGLNGPQGVATDGSGNVYIADGGNARVLKCTSGGSCAPFVSSLPDWAGDVAVDSTGNVYVLQYWQDVIRKYSSSGTFLGDLAGVTSVPYLTDASHINLPWGIVVAPDGSFYATERYGYRLLKYNSGGTQQWAVGQAGMWGGDNAHFGSWWGGLEGSPSLDSSGRIYVPDTGNNRIQVFSSSGGYVSTFGSTGTGNSQLHCPSGVAINPSNGDIAVADKCNQRVQVYNSSWGYKTSIGTVGVSGSDNIHLHNPWGVAFDSSGNIYVGDSDNYRVQKCSSSGGGYSCATFAGVTGTQGSDLGHLSHPLGVAVDQQGRVYVADEWNNRVQVLDSSGAYLTTIGGNWGWSTGGLMGPAAVAIDSGGNVYVTDRQNHRIQKYAPGVPSWVQTNINGFGDAVNWPVALASFGSQLYAGTQYDPIHGAQLWQTSTGSNWTSVMTNGFGNPHNGGIESLFQFNGNLYAGMWNWNPSTNTSEGGKIYRSNNPGNSTSWSDVTPSGLDPTNGDFLNFSSFNNQIFASTRSYTNTHGAEIWSSSDGSSWGRVMSNGFNNDTHAPAVASMTSFNSYLYASKINWNGMAQVWRCHTCTGSDWMQVNTDGFDNSTTYSNTVAISLASFNGYLYAGTRNWSTGGQIWRCSTCGAGSDWHQVVGPSSATPAGFGKITNGWIAALFVYKNMLYAGTYNDNSGAVSRTGMEVWRSADGVNWQQVGFAGFGDSNNLMPYYANSIASFNNNLYIGTENHANGSQVWEFLANSLYLPMIKR